MRKSLVLLMLLASSPLHAQGSRRWIVGFKPGAAPAERSRALSAAGLREIDNVDALGLVVAEPRIGVMSPGLAVLSESPKVALVMEDQYRIWINDGPSAYSDRWVPGLEDIMRRIRERTGPLLPVQAPKKVHPAETEEAPWGVRRVHAVEAWTLGVGDAAGVKVAIIDTGIDATHPDLAAAVAGGYNARSGSNDAWADDNGHGTHVAGTIAATHDGKGVVGVAPGARLYAVKVLDKDGGGFLTDIIKGIVWCAQHDIKVANMSLGADRSVVFMQWAVEYASARGVTIVAAAGNSGPPMIGSSSVGYPAGYADVIAVSALAEPQTGKPDAITSWSSRGPKVAFIAPGENIYSTVPGGGYTWHDGTSMATPHVTGLAALAVAHGAVGSRAVRAALAAAATPLPGLTSSEQGRGLIDARKLGAH